MFISFTEAIEQPTFLNEKVSLLLGNGFSIAQTNGAFGYRSLLDQSNFTYEVNSVFNRLQTVDFEEVVESLEAAAIIAQAYNVSNFYAQQLIADAQYVREELLRAVRAVHPINFRAIPEDELNNCANFLNNFDKIFTLNYDLLLYWVNMHRANSSDGFGRGDRRGRYHGPFREDAHCNVYNLHGGLHLFLTAVGDVEKVVCGYQEDLLDSVGRAMTEDSRLPLFVAEGTCTEKMKKIKSVPYLLHCYRSLCQLDGVLFIFGHSAARRDSHIYDAIFRSNNIRKVFFCVYDPIRNLNAISREIKWFQNNSLVDVQYVDSATVPVW